MPISVVVFYKQVKIPRKRQDSVQIFNNEKHPLWTTSIIQTFSSTSAVNLVLDLVLNFEHKLLKTFLFFFFLPLKAQHVARKEKKMQLVARQGQVWSDSTEQSGVILTGKGPRLLSRSSVELERKMGVGESWLRVEADLSLGFLGSSWRQKRHFTWYP